MGLSYQPKAITLSFKEGKPVTYKAQQVTYPTIKSKDLLAYAANAANVPLANIIYDPGTGIDGRAPRGGWLLPRREVEVRAHGGEP